MVALNVSAECSYLARVLASLQVSSAEHGVGDHAGVGTPAVTIGQDGDLQALQLVAVSSYIERRKDLEFQGTY